MVKDVKLEESTALLETVSLKELNKARFEDKIWSWKTCTSAVSAHAKLVGNNSKKASNSDINNFNFLKKFDINLNPRRQLATLEIYWSPPLDGWIKCNTDGVAIGNPSVDAYGGIFRNHLAEHVLSFCDFVGIESSKNAEFLGALKAIELAKQHNFSKLWIETDCTFVVNAFKNHDLVPWKF
ncbi:uncharacterized protein LOC131635273 [Vicia villosa]|uniref:uncharacterized protein LOC131635273 n=1 Tax=Vicia villosa TaxID=3911 RepID=UPI00273C40AA|nr:uncharacterized protein LOC131635273 [Vicia villosa]